MKAIRSLAVFSLVFGGSLGLKSNRSALLDACLIMFMTNWVSRCALNLQWCSLNKIGGYNSKFVPEDHQQPKRKKKHPEKVNVTFACGRILRFIPRIYCSANPDQRLSTHILLTVDRRQSLNVYFTFKSVRRPSRSHCPLLRAEFLHPRALCSRLDYSLLCLVHALCRSTCGGAATYYWRGKKVILSTRVK